MAKQRLYRSNEFELTLAEDKFYTNNVQKKEDKKNKNMNIQRF